jgi:hypothetical protein
LVEAGVVTNPVHVIDLSVFLPGLFITGILILRKIAVGVYMAAALLVFCIMMDITIGGLAIAINIKGMEPGYAVIGIMSALVLTSGALLAYYAKSINAAIRLQTAA